MDIKVSGSKARGTVFLSGNKNSALPVIAASILWPGKVKLYNIPNIIDVQLFLEFLESINVGVKYDEKKEVLDLDYTHLKNTKHLYIDNPGKLTKIRAVILLLSALAVRFKKVRFGSSFSGCNLGTRSLSVHFDNLRKLGFNVVYSLDRIEINSGKIENAQSHIWQNITSVTATEVALIVATRNPKTTAIYNSATEPHVQDTAYFLQKMGYKISGIGTNLLKITPGKLATNLASTKNKVLKFSIFSDHHEYATWLGIGAITGGDVKVVHNMSPVQLTPIDRIFHKFGFEVKHRELSMHDLGNYKRAKSKVYFSLMQKASSKPIFKAEDNIQKASADTKPIQGLYVSSLRKKRIFMPKPENNGYIHISPGPWPNTPVDILSLFIPLAAYSNVPVLFHNWMYDGGLFWTLELRKAGVSVVLLDPHRVIVRKDAYRTNATFEAPYIIRATIALLMYGLSMPKGATILNADAAFRGHPYFLEKLQAVGVGVQKIK